MCGLFTQPVEYSQNVIVFAKHSVCNGCVFSQNAKTMNCVNFANSTNYENKELQLLGWKVTKYLQM